ncbi:STAS domain-containing protein [Jeotgalibacillus aurantiacus]|uniref:STAS domain-containing protein n=1 Tax=Jeotgalibacillus aurantiacus TaxID=2763266 RepID=UPI001D0AFF2A|nr:STAS domain-containing protein [Jeotgalibacillus aurantiacus]
MTGYDSELDVKGNKFGWDMQKGIFHFEGQEGIVFWVRNAMKEFFDTIEEISGQEASHLVFEVAGFRQGTVVGDYFDGLTATEAAHKITDTYAAVGWGLAKVVDLNEEKKTFSIHIKNSWEYRINHSQGKRSTGPFLAAHYAGVFSRLLDENIWFEIKEDQLHGHDHMVVNYFPSGTTVGKNIHQLSRAKESARIHELEQMVEEKTRDLREVIKQISSPVIPVLDGIVVVPLLGRYDEERSEELVYSTLNKLPKYKADYLILDLTGLDGSVDQLTTSLLEKIGSAADLIGSKTILVGLSASLAVEITQAGVNLTRFDCFQTLQHGIHYAIGQMGKQII